MVFGDSVRLLHLVHMVESHERQCMKPVSDLLLGLCGNRRTNMKGVSICTEEKIIHFPVKNKKL